MIHIPQTAFAKSLSCLLAVLLIVTTTPIGSAQTQTPTPPATSNSYAGQGTPLSTNELQSLVAPIALYPDSLVAQVLNGATFPDQIAIANYWVSQHKDLSSTDLMKQVDTQTWDPSVKALTQFPSVLNDMAQNLSWTSSLGEAYHNQQSEVMTAIQVLRAQAKNAGNLKSGSQITVVQQTPQTIVIQPTNPQIVYVPQYNPTVVYGTTYVTPGYSTGTLVATSLLSFGAGIAVGAALSGGCCGWGYSSWNCNWYGGAAYYHGAPYYGNAAWHGGYYGGYGYHPYGGYNNYGYHPNYNSGYQNSGYHPNYNNGTQHYGNNNYTHNTVNVNNAANRSTSSDSWDKSGWGNSDASRGWGSQDSANRSSAFSGYSGHSSDSSFGSGGWGDRSSSSRGWGSRGGGGWGGGGGWSRGGGGFGGGGFRR
jgi:Protein of unknown function (DUF3300)